MPGATFSLTNKYAAAAVIVSDGAIVSGSKRLSSATAAFTIFDQGKKIIIEGAGAAAANLTTTIKRYISATVVEIADAASTTVTSSDLTYLQGTYRLSDLIANGDVDGNTYEMLNASRLQIQVNSLSPTGIIYIGGKYVSPTNCGIQLTTGLMNDNSLSGYAGDGLITSADYLTADVDAALINIYWHGVAQFTPA